jgi:hypothetical protein
MLGNSPLKHVKEVKKTCANQRTECKVECLGWEVAYNICSISPPEGQNALISVCSAESIENTFVRGGKATLLNLRLMDEHGLLGALCFIPSHLDSASKA